MDSDTEKYIRESIREDRKKAEACEALLRNPHFGVYVNILNTMVERSAGVLLEPVTGLDAIFGQEYLKGTMKGLIIARDLASATVQLVQGAQDVSEGEE